MTEILSREKVTAGHTQDIFCGLDVPELLATIEALHDALAKMEQARSSQAEYEAAFMNRASTDDDIRALVGFLIDARTAARAAIANLKSKGWCSDD